MTAHLPKKALGHTLSGLSSYLVRKCDDHADRRPTSDEGRPERLMMRTRRLSFSCVCSLDLNKNKNILH